MKNLPRRPHSTNIPGPRATGTAGKKSSLVTNTHASNRKLNSSTYETTETDDDKQNNQLKITQSPQKKKSGMTVANYNFYSKNQNAESMHSYENDISEDQQNNNHLKSIMFQSDSHNLLDGINNPLYNSLQMSTCYIEPPPNIHADYTYGDDPKNQKKNKNNLSYIIQSHTARVQQTNAFHTKIPPKKQNQTQLLIKCINNEGQFNTCKQIEQANLIKQKHFYDDLFQGGLRPQKQQQQVIQSEINDENIKDSVKKQIQQQQLLNVQNFNKSFYVQVNVNKQQKNKKNSIGSKNLIVDENGKLQLQNQAQQIFTQSTTKNQSENANSLNLSQQFQHKQNFPGRKLSIMNKETLNIIVKRLSQSMHQDNRMSVSSLNNSQNNNYNNNNNNLNQSTDDGDFNSSNCNNILMGLVPQSKMKASQTSKNYFFNRNYSLQSNNRAQTANKTTRTNGKQPCVKGVSIKNYYKNKALNTILNSQEDELSRPILINQKQNSAISELTQRDYQHLINQQASQQQGQHDDHNYFEQFYSSNMGNNISFEENENLQEQNQEKNINFLKNQAECYNSNGQSVDQQITNYIKDVKKQRLNSEADKRKKGQSFLVSSQSHRSRDGQPNGYGNKAQTSFNFYSSSQNQQQQFNNTGTNFNNRRNSSQLVEQGNHIERKLSNMSQDSHPYLETLVFGEYGTLESAIAKSNKLNLNNQFDQTDGASPQRNDKQSQDEHQQSYPLSSRYADNQTKSRNKNLNKKTNHQKSNKNIQKSNHELQVNKDYEKVSDCISQDENKSNIQNKNIRCVSARDESNYQSTQKSEDLKEKFLKNLNLRGLRQPSQEDLLKQIANTGSQCSFQEKQQENPRLIHSSIGENTQQDQASYLEQIKNSSAHNLEEFGNQNNSQKQLQENPKNIKTPAVYIKQPSNDYSNLIKVYEKSLATRTIEQPDYQPMKSNQQYLQVQQQQQITQDQPSSVQNERAQRKSAFVLKNENSHFISENSEAYSALQQVYNQPQSQFISQDIHRNENKAMQSLPTQMDNFHPKQLNYTGNTTAEHQVKSSQNTIEMTLNSQRRSMGNNKQQDLNGMFLPFRQDGQQQTNSSTGNNPQQKVIHANFPQKINTKFLKQKNMTNSQLYSYLLQKQNVSSSLESSLIAMNHKDMQLNNSQNDMSRIKHQQYSSSLRNSSLNNTITCNYPFIQETQRPKSPTQTRVASTGGGGGYRANTANTNQNNRKYKNKVENEEALQPWNDYTYVKYF